MKGRQQTTQSAGAAINPARVRYIKLGEGGNWERECLREGILRISFGTYRSDRFSMCLRRQWDALTDSFIADDRSKGTATRFTNETRRFFEDDGSTLWITFSGEQLWWGFLTPGPAQQHRDGGGAYRTVLNGWSKTDLKGESLTKDRLSGALTKLAAYRGTSCNVDVTDYVVRRINGEKTSQVERATAAMDELKLSILDLTKLLGLKDFEILVDLIFTTSGWRRVGVVGKTQKTLDIDLMLPSTQERAFVQVKSTTTSADLASYIGQLEDCGPYDRMFYVFHSGNAVTDDERVTVIGPDRLADMVLNAGLTEWLVRKVS